MLASKDNIFATRQNIPPKPQMATTFRIFLPFISHLLRTHIPSSLDLLSRLLTYLSQFFCLVSNPYSGCSNNSLNYIDFPNSLWAHNKNKCIKINVKILRVAIGVKNSRLYRAKTVIQSRKSKSNWLNDCFVIILLLWLFKHYF